jgi:hypothetical protein
LEQITELPEFFSSFVFVTPTYLFLLPRHTKAVLQKDHALFGQGDSFLQINQHAIRMPTEAEVQALINPNQSTSAS